MRAVLFDTETTGLDPLTGDRVIEVAAIELVNDLPTRTTFHRLIHPQRDIPDDATRIHGITLEHLRNAPRFEEIVDDLLAFLGDGPLVAHNAPFDFGFLDAELARCGRPRLDRARMVDTLALAKTRFPGMPNSLDALCRRFGIDNSMREKHGALLDSEILAEVYLELIGGRQPDLVLAAAAPAPARSASGEAITWRPRPRPEPLPPRITEEELAAHAAMLAKLGDAAIWKKDL
jgi:DNA polymerase-3 subunit epsilon